MPDPPPSVKVMETTQNGLPIERMFATVTDMAGTPDGHREQRGERPGADALVGLLGVVPADLTDGEVTDALLGLVELSGRCLLYTSRCV